ncbi:A24 family peptidase C-terminal domain-containing protein, partial [[Eubacterium] cellulosolvens]
YPVGLVLMALRLTAQTSSWMVILLSVVSAAVLSLALSYLGLWGGADGKGFTCLALMNPLVPVLGVNLSHIVNPLFPLVVFSNAYVASLVSMLYPIQRNLRARRMHELFEGLEDERFVRKVAAFLTGYRVPVRELESKPFLFLLESVDQQGSTVRRHFNFKLGIETDRQKELADLKAAVNSGRPHGSVWVSPGLPFLLFVAVGLVLSVVFGDIVWCGLSTLSHHVAALI